MNITKKSGIELLDEYQLMLKKAKDFDNTLTNRLVVLSKRYQKSIPNSIIETSKAYWEAMPTAVKIGYIKSMEKSMKLREPKQLTLDLSITL